MAHLEVVVLDSKPCEVQLLHESGRILSLMYCKWYWNEGEPSGGYKEGWREAGNGNVLSHKGGARIPTAVISARLRVMAMQAGWYGLICEDRYNCGKYTTTSYKKSYEWVQQKRVVAARKPVRSAWPYFDVI